MLDDREQRIPIRPHHKQGLKRLRVILNLAKDALGQEPDVVQELQPLALPLDRLNPHAPADRLQDELPGVGADSDVDEVGDIRPVRVPALLGQPGICKESAQWLILHASQKFCVARTASRC